MAAVSRFGPPLALMGLIFFLSSIADLNSGLGAWDLFLRKCAHMAEFGVLFLLWRRALPAASPWMAVAIAIGYAITDEIHQGYVQDRHASPVDVLIDATGVGIAFAAARVVSRGRAG